MAWAPASPTSRLPPPELGRARLQVPLAETIVAGSLIASLASDAVRREVLGGLSEGTALPIPALAEPLRARSPQPTDVVASGSGDARTLTGTKAPVLYAPDATHLVVTAATDAGTGVFLVTALEAAKAEVVLDGTSATLLAQGEAADSAISEALALGGVVLCAEAVGAMEEALRLTTDYLDTRTQFGRKLASFQTLTHRAADMYAQLELARSATLYAAMVADERPVDVDHVLRARLAVDRAARLIGRGGDPDARGHRRHGRAPREPPDRAAHRHHSHVGQPTHPAGRARHPDRGPPQCRGPRVT
ncbi:acyl-CoA dehydrogenase family protein [Janibacter limosus]|uniref:Uncharacterized protein n=1 Tax=Janibacter limosus TaxID=53458 RepID=A0AC61U381_9MICO|nr:acyl-CoA dehydrogenase family protein [Janibacter limosus]UUZ44465.1 acyl-CoA dehydrogenase family protein [Janibacter limosus]